MSGPDIHGMLALRAVHNEAGLAAALDELFELKDSGALPAELIQDSFDTFLWHCKEHADMNYTLDVLGRIERAGVQPSLHICEEIFTFFPSMY